MPKNIYILIVVVYIIICIVDTEFLFHFFFQLRSEERKHQVYWYSFFQSSHPHHLTNHHPHCDHIHLLNITINLQLCFFCTWWMLVQYYHTIPSSLCFSASRLKGRFSAAASGVCKSEAAGLETYKKLCCYYANSSWWYISAFYSEKQDEDIWFASSSLLFNDKTTTPKWL